MKHLTEEELIAYREGEPTQREAIAEHLTSCTACRTELDRIETCSALWIISPSPSEALSTAAPSGKRLRRSCRKELGADGECGSNRGAG